MTYMQKSYHSFVESVCKQFDCTDAISPLQDGFTALCEADMGYTRTGSAWDGVEWIHVYHAADPRMDMDIKLDSLWATRQKYSATREDVIGRFIEDAEDFNKWLATSEDGGAFITSASIKFKGEPDAITVDIPCPAGVDDLVSCNCQLRQPTTDELYKFIMKATKEKNTSFGETGINRCGFREVYPGNPDRGSAVAYGRQGPGGLRVG